MAGQQPDIAASNAPLEQSDTLLAGVQLAARGIAHACNNDLTAAIGRLSLVLIRADLPAAAREDLLRVEASLQRTSRHLQQFEQVVRVVTRDTPAGPLLDLEQSIAPPPPR